MRRPVVAGNWKMNGDSASIAALLGVLRDDLTGRDVDVIVFPPAAYLASVVESAAPFAAVGAQNVNAASAGAFTGEVSAEMIADVGATHVLVGHSERRTLFGETDTEVATKFLAAQRAALVPVLCVGESLDAREAGNASAVVLRQLEAVLVEAGIEAFANALLAYEPVWAIGTGKTAAPSDAQAMHAVLRERLAQEDAEVAAAVRILYGGSVKADNAHALFAEPDVDGGLVGGASLDALEFAEIYRAA